MRNLLLEILIICTFDLVFIQRVTNCWEENSLLYWQERISWSYHSYILGYQLHMKMNEFMLQLFYYMNQSEIYMDIFGYLTFFNSSFRSKEKFFVSLDNISGATIQGGGWCRCKCIKLLIITKKCFNQLNA